MKNAIMKLRFWYKKPIVADYTAYKLRYYNVDVTNHSELARLYTVCPYAVLVSFTEENVADFEDVVKMAMGTAEVGEILIGNEWLKMVK